MSADKHNHIVSKLVTDAEKTNDPARLYVIREKLYQLGAWGEARHVWVKVRELERAYAEKAAK